MERRHIALTLVLIFTLLTAGCAKSDEKQNTASQQEVKKSEAPAAATSNTTEKKETKAENIQPSSDRYKDGIYYGVGGGKETGMKITIEVRDGKISKVTVNEHNETKGYTDEAIEEIPKRIVAKNSTEVDVISRVTITSEGIKYVVKNALKDAKIN